MIENLRKQYHFRPSPGGFYAWDVHRLIRMSELLPVINYPVKSVEDLNENFWYLGGEIPTCISILKHFQLISEVSLDYPIILSAENSVMDGMHRVCRAYLNGSEFIRAVKFDITPDPDYTDVQPEDLPY